MIPRSTTGPIDELAATIVDTRSRLQTVELLAHRHRYDLDPTPWTPVVFNPGWANLGVFAFANCEYRKVGDVVQMRGVATGVPPAAIGGGPMFNLPLGFRPPLNLQFGTVSNNAFGMMIVNFLGDVFAFVGALPSFSIQASFSVTV